MCILLISGILCPLRVLQHLVHRDGCVIFILDVRQVARADRRFQWAPRGNHLGKQLKAEDIEPAGAHFGAEFIGPLVNDGIPESDLGEPCCQWLLPRPGPGPG